MAHLEPGLRFLALAVGAGSLAQAVMLWLRHRTTVIRHHALFLLATWLILLALAAIVGVLQAAGGLLCIGASPFF